LLAKEKNFLQQKNSGVGRKKNLHLCRVGAFENPQSTRGCLRAGFWIPLCFGGLASAGHTVGSQRVLHRFVKRTAGSRTLQRFVRPATAAQRECTTSGRQRQDARNSRRSQQRDL